MNLPMDSSPPRPPRHVDLIRQLVLDPHLWILALAPFFILFISSNWIFTAANTIDPWVYHGYFRNLLEYKATLFPGTYYGGRLSWILPGYLAYELLPPLAANYILHFSVWYAAIFGLYYCLRATAGRQAGLVAAILLGSYGHFLQAAGWDYVDGPAIAYFLVCLALLTAAAARPQGGRMLVLAGMSFACVLFSNLFTVILAPVAATYFAVLAGRTRGRLTIREGMSAMAWFLAGAAAVTTLLGCVNLFLDGNFAFYMPSVYFVLAQAGKPNQWKRPVAEWIGQADWLVLPLVVTAATLIALGNPRFRRSAPVLAAAGAFLVTCLLMLLSEGKGIPVLQYSYYATYLIPPMFLLIGALLGAHLERLGETAAVLLALAVLAIGTVPLWGRDVVLTQHTAGVWSVGPLLFGGLLAVCAAFPGKLTAWALPAALSAYLAANTFAGHSFADRHARRDVFARISQAADSVDTARGKQFPWFWYNKADPNFTEFHALHSIYLWGYTMVSNEFPAIQSEAQIVDGMLVLIPTSEQDILSLGRQELRSRMFTLESLDRQEINASGVRYFLQTARLRFDSARLQPLALRPCVSGGCSVLAPRDEPGPAQLPLNGWIASGDPQMEMQSYPHGVWVSTPLTRQGYAAKYGPLSAETAGGYVFKLQYQLAKGGIVLGARSSEESDWLARTKIPVSHPGERTAVLSLEATAGEPFWLMIANDHPLGDHASQFVIVELEAYRIPAEDAAMQAQSASP